MITYSAEVYARLFARYHADIWPLPPAALAVGILLLLLALRPGPARGAVTLTTLASAWVFCGAIFQMRYLAELDPLSWIAGSLYILQGILLLRPTLFGPKPLFDLRGGPVALCGLLLALAALIAYPLQVWLEGPLWQESPAFGITPPSLALFTLGVLLMTRGPIALHLLIIPLLAALQAGIIAASLERSQEIPILLLAPLAVMIALWHNHGRKRSRS